MAITQTQTHFRSISLPSRLDQINTPNFESEFEKLSSSSTSESIQSKILGLAELYNSIEEFTQKSAAREEEKSTEESLSQSDDLLDACTAVKELLQMIRENVQTLQSALRRKGLDAGIQNDVASYFSFRKRMQKTVAKTLKSLKKSEGAIVKNGSASVNADGDFGFVLRQLAGMTISIFMSVLVYVSYAAARPGGWSMVSKLLTTTAAAAKCGGESEVERMDLGLSCLQGKMRSDGVSVVELQKTMQNVDDIIQGFEGGLERLFRQLVQTRVTLLNILTDC